MTETIFALSSGAPPAAIGVIRISGPEAGKALEALSGALPVPRQASVRVLKDAQGEVLDRALVIWFPGPRTATGEDLAELHCHGGRAVVAAIEQTLASLDGVRRAQPGEFTRRAFANGVMDLAEAEGLADLLSSETELQRRAAQAAAGGSLSRSVEEWRSRLLGLSALVEAALDFADEDDVGGLSPQFSILLNELRDEWKQALGRPRSERLRDGVRVVLAGPPNAGKSSLFNALLDEGAAIVTPEAGTTRDAIERPVAIGGVPFVLIDTAGIRNSGAGEIEMMGIERARDQLDRADLILWLGPEGKGPEAAVEVAARCDVDAAGKVAPDYIVSALTGQGIDELSQGLVQRAKQLIPRPGDVALNWRQFDRLSEAFEALSTVDATGDPLVLAEHLRLARVALDRLQGRQSTEDMLDQLFGRFCIGK